MIWIVILSLLLIGLTLIIVELIFIPGTTVVGLLGAVFTVVGIVITYRQFGNTVGLYMLIGTGVVTGIAIFYSFKTGAWNRFALRSSIDSKVNEGKTDSLQVGDTGTTVSALRPIGNALFHEKIFEVRTTGDYIEANTKVRIIQVSSQQIIVELVQ